MTFKPLFQLLRLSIRFLLLPLPPESKYSWGLPSSVDWITMNILGATHRPEMRCPFISAFAEPQKSALYLLAGSNQPVFALNNYDPAVV